MSLYSEYYFSASPSISEFNMLEIEHFRFSPTIFRLTPDANVQDISGTDDFGNERRGVIVTHEGGAGPFEYEYLPMKIERTSQGADLDQSIKVTMGDVGSILAKQLYNIDFYNANQIKPIVRYRAYRSDTLSAPLTTVPSIFEMKRVTFNEQGCSFEAVSPYLNVGRTGRLYTIKTFPTMKAFFRNR